MTTVLGISAFYHDSAAALVRDGEIVAAAQEERFTRVKHDHRFPKHAADYCLAEAGITADRLDAVVFYEKPLVKFERLLSTYLAFAPRGLRSFMRAMPLWLRDKLFIPREIDRELGGRYAGPIWFTRHHESHAASAFFPSPFDEAAIVTVDGVGEWSTTTVGVGRGNRIELLKELRFPHSLGLLYSAFTSYTGFKVNSGEYKVMGLAPYGEPRYAKLILEKIVDLKDDGSFRLDQRYFNYAAGLTMTSARFHELFGGPPRAPESKLTQKEMDLAASVQAVTEEIMLRLARHAREVTGQDALCLAGGVALNCVANGRLLREGPFKRIWIEPAAGDAGGALGAALYGWHQIMDRPRTAVRPDAQRGSYLGPGFTNEEARASLDSMGAKYEVMVSDEALAREVAALLEAGKVVGLVQGRMEFGPRALGARSIIGDPRNTAMQATMNLKIKFRESFRPFAPSCLKERLSDYFEMDTSSPYMLLVGAVRAKRRKPMTEEQKGLFGIDRLNVIRSDIPAVTHVDYSARVQTVDKDTAPRYHGIIKAFEERTGCGVIVNTSFNIRGEPIVLGPKEAYRCFMFTDMDALVVERCLLRKEAQPPMAGAEEYKRKFELD
ncbi:MAG: carbamoyltransferase [Deltaproteobacteria bacterium]|nr:carbamoyltransferase [Deltaproteobacteria bacterium]